MSKASSALIEPAANPVSDPSPVGLRFTSRLNHEPPPVTTQLGWRYQWRSGRANLLSFGQERYHFFNRRQRETTRMRRSTFSAAAAALLGSSVLAHGQASPSISFIQVDRDVKLEVIDWGGTGRPVVLLAGNTQTAHDFTDFAPRLASTYHVYGITRRGFGVSSPAASGYSADQLADDVLAVIDSLGLTRPVLAGHSLAGEELSSIGSRHPEKVAGLIYLDAANAYAFYDSTRGDIRIDQNEVQRGLRELRVAASKGAAEEMRRLTRHLLTTDLPALERSLREIEERTPAVSSNPPTRYMPPPETGINRLIHEGMQRYTDIRAPVLAIYALRSISTNPSAADDPGRVRVLQALNRGAPAARVVILPDATHDVFRSNEADVLREMRAFIATLPVRVSTSP
jgi:non-heme chloroperoxidase